MKIIGLTGGVASGKNFIADLFAKKGALIFDADHEVHDILHHDQEALSLITKAFPAAILNHQVDRKSLGQIVFNDPKKLRLLESIIHPKVRQRYDLFLKKAQEMGAKMIVLNIPLLLESKSYEADIVIAITASKKIRKQRFVQRYRQLNPDSSLTDDELSHKFELICQQQISDQERSRYADFVITNDLSKDHAIKQVELIVSKL